MSRNLKVLGFAAVAVFAVSAMLASAASAAYWFKSDATAGKITTLAGESIGEDVFTVTSGIVKCQTVHYTGSTVGPTQTQVTLHPVYTGCTAFGFGATVETTGCNYVFDATATNFVATMTVECNAGTELTVVAKLAGVTKCTLHIGAQDIGTVNLTNGTKANGVKDIHADISLSETIAYKHTAGTGAGACTTGSGSNGSYFSTTTVTGFNEAGAETHVFLE